MLDSFLNVSLLDYFAFVYLVLLVGSLEAGVGFILVKVAVWLPELQQEEARVVPTAVEHAHILDRLHHAALKAIPGHFKLLTFVDLNAIHCGTGLSHVLA